MAEINAGEWLAVLEVLARRPPDEANAEWEWLMDQLGLGPEYFLAIYAAIQQGRWRAANNPKAYLKTVAKREAGKIDASAEGDAELVFPGEIECDGEEISQEERLDSMQHELDSVGPLKGGDGVWRPGGGLDAYYENEEDEDPREPGNPSCAKLPRRFTKIAEPSKGLAALINQINASTDEVHIHLQARTITNWKKWATAAGLDQWERKVLDYKTNGVSRDRALKAQPDESSRKAIQAAWRRFDRNGIIRLVAAAKKHSVENVPE